MKIKIKCRINSLKINDTKSVGVKICDELQLCNSIKPFGLNICNNQPYTFKSKNLSKNLTIEKADKFFDFISAHSRETFIITIKKKNKTKKKNNETSSTNETEPATIKLDGVVYKVVGIELIYG